MRFELKKIMWRKETLIMSGLALLFFCICIMRLETPRLAKEYRKEIATYDKPYNEIQQELHTAYREAAATDGADIVGSPERARYAVLSDLDVCANRYDRFFEERKQMLATLQEKIDTAPTEYVRKDLQKAYHAYNYAYTFRVINSSNVQIAFLQSEVVIYDIVYLLFLLVLFCGLFANETETKMNLLLYTAKRGKHRLFWNKLYAAIPILGGTAFLFTVIPFLGIWIKNGLSFCILLEPLQCVEQFRMCPYAVSILQFLLFSWGALFLVGISVLSIITACSAFFRESIPVFVISGLCIFGVFLLGVKEEWSPETARLLYRFGGFQLLDVWKYFVEYDTVNIAGLPVIRLIPAILFTMAFSLFLVMLAYGLYVRPLRRGGNKVVGIPSVNKEIR